MLLFLAMYSLSHSALLGTVHKVRTDGSGMSNSHLESQLSKGRGERTSKNVLIKKRSIMVLEVASYIRELISLVQGRCLKLTDEMTRLRSIPSKGVCSHLRLFRI